MHQSSCHWSKSVSGCTSIKCRGVHLSISTTFKLFRARPHCPRPAATNIVHEVAISNNRQTIRMATKHPCFQETSFSKACQWHIGQSFVGALWKMRSLGQAQGSRRTTFFIYIYSFHQKNTRCTDEKQTVLPINRPGSTMTTSRAFFLRTRFIMGWNAMIASPNLNDNKSTD